MKNIFIYIFLFLSLNSIAQSDVTFTPKDKRIKYDTTRIKDYSDHLSLWLYGIQKLYSLEIRNSDIDKTLKVSPNGQTNIGVGFNYKWMGIGVAFKSPFAKNDDDIYGETSRLDAQFNVFTRSFGMDMSFQYYKGYYISNPEDFIKHEDEEEYPQLPNLETVSLELSAYYFTNHRKFSYRAAFVRNEVQLKGAGSPIFGIYTRIDIAHDPDGFIPEVLPDSLKHHYNITAFANTNYGLSVGYTYTFVIWKKFFINLSFVPGLGAKSLKIYTTEGEFVPKIGLSARIVARSAIGYEHKYFYLGISQISITNTFQYNNLHFSAATTKFRFFVGKRFNINKKK